MKLVIILSLLASAVLATRSRDELFQLYLEKLAEYRPDVDGIQSDDGEQFNSFVTFVREVDEHNEEDGEHWTAAINEFSIMTPEERQQYLGLNASGVIETQQQSLQSAFVAPILENLAATVDYTSKLPPIKSQGSCGSCWTFGATAALEYQINRNSNNLKRLSEQQYLDCVYEGKRDGCKGGWPSACYEWTKNNKNMIASMTTYPYKARDGKCKTDVKSAISGFRVTGTKYLERGDDNMLAAVADPKIGVISVAIGVKSSFYKYSSGVYREEECSRINHAVNVVGYGTLNGEPYWRVRNSWGTGWGDGGYMNMLRGPNTCAVSSYGHYPLVSGSSDGDDDYDGDDDDGEDKSECWQSNMGMFPDSAILAQPRFVSDEICIKLCQERSDCKAAVSSPRHWAYRECFLVSAHTVTARNHWASALKSCFGGDDDGDDNDDSNDDDGDDNDDSNDDDEDEKCWRSDTGIKHGSILAKSEFVSDEICMRLCQERSDCEAAVSTPSYWEYRECFTISAPTVISLTGWKIALKSCFGDDDDDDDDDDNDEDDEDDDDDDKSDEGEKCEHRGMIRHFSGKCLYTRHPLGEADSPDAGTTMVTASICDDIRLYCLRENGDIVNEVSGLCLVPRARSDNPPNDDVVELGPCNVSYSKWSLTDEGSIRHQASGKCWHPFKGSARPINNNPVVLYDGCDEDRLQFTFT